MHISAKMLQIAGALPALMVFVVGTGIGGAQQARETLVVSGYSEEAPVVRMNGRAYIDVENLARITQGSLAFQGSRMVLTLNANPETQNGPSGRHPETGFSKAFIRAGIEAQAATREWMTGVADNLQHGYPVENGIGPYRARAVDGIRLASVAASTNSDHRGLELLNAEVKNMDNWTNELVNRAQSLELGSFMLSDTGFDNDALFQKAQHCSQFIASMLSSGTFQDDPLCH